jgi:DNA-binding response OmpR family regulator
MGRRPCIVLVEDSLDEQEFVRLAIKSTGFDVNLVVIGTGEEALDYVCRRGTYTCRPPAEVPSLVFLDIHLGGPLTGFDVLHAMRVDPALRFVPVVMFSTSDDQRDVRLAYEGGANSYLQKSTSLDGARERARIVLTYWLQFNLTADYTR